MFYVQCYITSPAVLLVTLVFRFTTTLNVFQEYLLVSIIFLVFYETFVMKIELKTNWLGSIGHAILPLIVTAFLIALLVVVVNIA